MSISDDWSVPCYGDDAEFEPTPDELDAMYQQLEAGETLEIGWKCPGRRPPTPIKVVTETKEKTKAKKYVAYVFGIVFVCITHSEFSMKSLNMREFFKCFIIANVS